jgi:septum formation protein
VSPPQSPRLILASASPRRQQLLREAGYDFVVHPADIDEDDHPAHILPADLAEYLAVQKAKAVALLPQFRDDVVLAADTVVAFGDRSLGKPADAAEARRMLDLLSGTTHIVITGVSVMRLAVQSVARSRVMSAVRMRPLSVQEIAAYVATNGWQGKAGGYGIQDKDPFVIRQAGCLTNIVGLPVPETRRMLEQAGIRPAAGGTPDNSRE